jgi:YD repeat-containing protein
MPGTIADCLLLIPANAAMDAYEVDLRTGRFILAKTDLFVPDSLPISFTRSYRPWKPHSSVWDHPARHLYDLYPVGDRHPYTYIQLILPDGTTIHYGRVNPGTGYADAVYANTTSRTLFRDSQFKWNGNGWDLTLKDGTVYIFPEAYNARRPGQGALVSLRDPSGKVLRLARDRAGNLVRVTSPSGHWMELNHGGGRLLQARDHLDRVIRYSYDEANRLVAVTDNEGGVTRYSYDQDNRLLTIIESGGALLLSNEYDASGRVVRQSSADGRSYGFYYTTDAYGNVLQTEVTDQQGKTTTVSLGSTGYALSPPE